MKIFVVHNSDNALAYFRSAHMKLYQTKASVLVRVNIDRRADLNLMDATKGDLVIVYGLGVFLKLVLRKGFFLRRVRVVLFITGLGFYSYMPLLKFVPFLRRIIRWILEGWAHKVILLNRDDFNTLRLKKVKQLIVFSEGLNSNYVRTFSREISGLSEVRIVYSGRNHAQKRLRSLNFWLNLQAERSSVPVRFIVLGDIPKSIFVSRQPNLNVEYIGRVDNPLDYIAEAHVGIMMSREGEGMSFFMLECLLLKKKFISPRCPGVNDLNWHPLVYDVDSYSLEDVINDRIDEDLVTKATIWLDALVSEKHVVKKLESFIF